MPEAAGSKTFSQLLWVSGSRIALVGTWFLATIVMGRVLGVAAFGLYVYCQTVIKIVTGCVGDPLDMAVMRKGPLLLKSDRSGLLQLVRSAFWIRVVIGLAVLAIALALPAMVSKTLFNRPDYQTLVMLTTAGVLGDFLLRSVLGWFQIGEQFGRFIAVDSIWQGGRVIAVLVLVMLHKLTPTSAIALYVLVPYAAFAVACFLLPADLRQPAPPHRGELTDILHYSKWMVAGLAMAAAYEQLDKLLLVHLRGDQELGIYAAAFTFAVIPDFLNGIIQTVLGPKIAPAYAAGEFNAMQRSYLRYAVPAGLLFALVTLPIAGWVIRVFMGPKFLPAANVFRILILATLFNSICTPLPEALMNFIAPRRVTLFTAIGLAWVLVCGLLIIPSHGAMGAAVTILSARLIVGGMIIAAAHRLAQQNGSQPPAFPVVLPAHAEESV
jgi:O-antigen/teichoic acid export membrane protein